MPMTTEKITEMARRARAGRVNREQFRQLTIPEFIQVQREILRLADEDIANLRSSGTHLVDMTDLLRERNEYAEFVKTFEREAIEAGHMPG